MGIDYNMGFLSVIILTPVEKPMLNKVCLIQEYNYWTLQLEMIFPFVKKYIFKRAQHHIYITCGKHQLIKQPFHIGSFAPEYIKQVA